MINHILIVGSGNLAWHWANALTSAPAYFDTLHVYARNSEQLKSFANLFQLTSFNRINDLPKNQYDLIILAISDDAIEIVSSDFVEFGGILVHCAGSLSLSAINRGHNSTGVIYPLQTFTKGKKVAYHKIHFFLEAGSPEIAIELEKLVSNISSNIHFFSTEQRLALHIAAVIANNFTNHFMALADQICNDHNIDFKSLQPLMEETVDKLHFLSPNEAQTGPAIRGNIKIIKQHVKALENYPHIASLYKVLSESIINFDPSNKKQT